MKNAKLQVKGFTLIASLLMLLLLSGLAIGLLMMVNTEGKVGGTDLQNNVAFHAADGGIEKMATDLSATFKNLQSPKTSDICNLSGTAYQPSLVGVTWTQYSVQPASGCTVDPPTHVWGQIQSGPNQGLWAQIIPITMLTTAAVSGGQEVSMTRTAQVALIPVFQFGVFSESDVSFFSGPNFTVGGPVHTNGDLYPFVGPGSTLTFQGKVEAFGNVVRTQLANGYGAATNYAGTVDVATTSSNGCSTPTTNCVPMSSVTGASFGDGSVTGAGGNPIQSAYNGSNWNSFSTSGAPTGVNYMMINGNYGSTTTPGTGAKQLSMPFVNGSNFPYQIIRRPQTSDAPALSQSREYNLAQIRVLLSDDPAEFQNGTGATDPNNVRLANVPANSSGAYYNPYGIPMTAGNYPSTYPSPSPNTYSLYFATASNAIPAAPCASPTCAADWPYPPAPWTGAMMAAVGAGSDSNCTLLCPTGAPYISNNGGTVSGGAGFPNSPALAGGGLSSVVPPTLTPCPAASMQKGTNFYPPLAGDIPVICSTPPTGAGWPSAPYFPLVASNTTYSETAANGNLTATWNLIDGWLRVEYKDASGIWHPVTNEWLQLGFARGLTAPTAPGTNPVSPNAILLLQEPADRVTSGSIPATLSITGSVPVCTAVSAGSCTAWSVTPPQLLTDPLTPTIPLFGSTTAAQAAAPGSSTLAQESLTRFNWYPINFYDAREGEVRDTQQAGCTANGLMNAVEIDVGNLKQWLAGATGVSGTNVDYAAENGYVLYFSDRRGMLPNPNAPYSTTFTKSGDSGLEDVINGSVTLGTPNGTLEPTPAGKTISPEDVNENGLLDNFGPLNEGLGFYGTVGTPGKNLNTQITSTAHPDPFGTAANARMNSCVTARKNWVSGARHALRLVDGSLGNVPLSPVGTVADPGGFTVASENPVYVWGDYNSNPGDTTWNSPAVDVAGHSSTAIIADTVTLLSNNWTDPVSFGLGSSGTVTSPGDRNATTSYYRTAIAAGKNVNFPQPTWGAPNDFGTDGGVHNFLRYLENWGGQTLNYKGSIVSLYYATYGTGVYKCCTTVYSPPTRNYIFDTDFTSPSGLPPGTPMFRDVETLSYRQLFTARQTGQ
ncbi:MAG: hypothetical protein ABSD75_26355 [Terriglobales bacterium]|jgi:Tfp pilus assembly protein PilX